MGSLGIGVFTVDVIRIGGEWTITEVGRSGLGEHGGGGRGVRISVITEASAATILGVREV